MLAKAAEILCVVTQCASPSLAAKICKPSYTGRFFYHTLEGARPTSVLVHSLSCTSLLYTKALASSSYQAFRSNVSHGALVTANPKAADGMLAIQSKLLNLLDTSVWKVTYFSTHQWDSGVFSEILDSHSLGNLQLIDSYATRRGLSQPVLLFKSVTNGVYLTLPWDPGAHIYVENAQLYTLAHELLGIVRHIGRGIWFSNNGIYVHPYAVISFQQASVIQACSKLPLTLQYCSLVYQLLHAFLIMVY